MRKKTALVALYESRKSMFLVQQNPCKVTLFSGKRTENRAEKCADGVFEEAHSAHEVNNVTVAKTT